MSLDRVLQNACSTKVNRSINRNPAQVAWLNASIGAGMIHIKGSGSACMQMHERRECRGDS